MTNPFENVPLLPANTNPPQRQRDANGVTRQLCPDGKWRIVIKPCPLSLVEESIFGTESPGWCVACGTEAMGVEPDARRYTCDNCDLKQVYGAEECNIMGWVDVKR